MAFFMLDFSAGAPD